MSEQTKSNPFAPRPRGGYPEVLKQIRTWVRDTIPLDAEDTISVTELNCAEPDCPPKETVIVVMRDSGPWEKMRIHKAMPDVTEVDILFASRAAETVTPKAG
ncbi:MAG: hypothetical protein AAFV69_14645 [Pseudomonadota bacterium]